MWCSVRGGGVVSTSRGGSTSAFPQLQQVPGVADRGSVMFCFPQWAQSTTASRTARSASRHCDSRTRAAGSCRPRVKFLVNRARRESGTTAQVASTVACSTGSGALERSCGSNRNSGSFPYSLRSAASSKQRMSSSRLPISG